MDTLAELKAIEEIRQLKSRYFRFLDTRDWDGMATVFCSDAVFDLRAGAKVDPGEDPSEEANILCGRDQILDFLSNSLTGVVSVHHGHGHEVWVDGPDKARGVIAMEDINTRADTGELIVQGYGHYHEDYVRDAGHWRIARSRLSRLKVTLGPGFC